LKLIFIDLREYTYNRISHFDPILSMEKMIDLVTIGPNLGASKNYFEKTSKNIISIIKKEKPDCILTYNMISKNTNGMRHLTEVIKNIDIPKFHISVDYGRDFLEDDYLKEYMWFKTCGYSAVFFKYISSYNLKCPIKKYHLPHSISVEKWKAADKNKKENKIAFAGTLGKLPKLAALYKKRNMAVNYFCKKNMLVNQGLISNKRLTGADYRNFLGSHAFGITCSSECNFLLAKHIEIPASGAVLITDGTAEGISYLPKDSFITYDINNMEESEEKILGLMSDIVKAKNFSEKLKTFVYENCDHSIRYSFLINKILENI
jgi:hypothetical protein